MKFQAEECNSPWTYFMGLLNLMGISRLQKYNVIDIFMGSLNSSHVLCCLVVSDTIAIKLCQISDVEYRGVRFHCMPS